MNDFEAFYRSRYGPLAAQLYAYLGDAAEAEDVVQEAFLRAWQRWDAVSGYEDPIAWVRKVAWNLAASRWRHLLMAARVRLRLLGRADAEPVRPDHVALVAGLQRIPDRHRRALVLHYIADLPVAEVAAQLDVPKGTVLSWLHRGRQELAAHLGPAHQSSVESGAA
ncbi:RNA polymerase sigma factor [Phytohabitans rumicis]|uniref:RNA polymerase sigma24 factor n=1 Tax=Phytohabitans rumicis TaxID=1076125 RepID=A0A6V8KUV6_9ACTN|nr:SigE family RNA polymerase sigma factor [Phytohabitans rumicis]GFJ88852.1 RNA polymerase sigma24 factor [Phytohabitans rumicis]